MLCEIVTASLYLCFIMLYFSNQSRVVTKTYYNPSREM